jgi:hypothetical protein
VVDVDPGIGRNWICRGCTCATAMKHNPVSANNIVTSIPFRTLSF